MKRLNSFLAGDFIFSPRYRVWRHIIYWSFHIMIWAAFWIVMGAPTSYGRQLFNMTLWVPVFILFGYPLVYGGVPYLLLKEGLIVLFGHSGLGRCGAVYRFRVQVVYLYSPARGHGIGFHFTRRTVGRLLLCMTTSAASPMIIKFFKLCTIKQQEWIQTQQERINADLQLLKAQVHPHFLFNTLNNIYSFSMERSPKTPGLILKLSSLLSYMLYDCKAEEVRLEREIETMKNYIDLEKERHGDTIEISWNVEGDLKGKFIPPLLMLPFLENAFKHGVSDQIDKPWLSIDISVKSDTLRCKIVNSKNEFVSYSGNGLGITNVKKRLEFIYSGKHELKLNDEGNFFVVSILVKLAGNAPASLETPVITQTIRHETPLPAYP